MKNTTNHPLQSEEWANFRLKTGVKYSVVDDLFITLHPIPYTNFKIGYLPKGPDLNEKIIKSLINFGRQQNCIFIQIEPNIESENKQEYKFKNLYKSAHPLFTQYTFILDLTKSEEELLKNMHPKTRYNIRLAEKKGVKITEDNSNNAFEEYLKLTQETTNRQKFYSHNQKYHKTMWESLKQNGTLNTEKLSAHLFKATYNNQTLVTWILFIYKDTLYYPYGASSSKNREVMASNIMMWEAIKFGKKIGLTKFDMWGALGNNPNPNDPWYGFHKFKEGYGGKHVKFMGSYDLVINSGFYSMYKIINKIRWLLLYIKK